MDKKIIRDAVHGDIELTADEIRIVHTREFQRLHGCRQLGLTHLVFPGAKHSRFEHSLGVMHVASAIADRLKSEDGVPYFHGEQGLELKKILRLAALLHDVGHVPFGHTLEDEMPLIAKHDSAGSGKASRMDRIVSDLLEESGQGKYREAVLGVLRAINESKNDRSLYALVEGRTLQPEWLILADIIGNTICADLLDYIRRDHLMSGIRGDYDERILLYFSVGKHVVNDVGHDRIVIRLIKNGRVRTDALSELLDVLKLRYNLSEKVLYHPKKCSADAMLARAVEVLGLGEKELMSYSDDGLLDSYRDQELIAAIRARNLYKPVFSCGIDGVQTFGNERKEDLVDRLHKNPDLRRRVEQRVCSLSGIEDKSSPLLIFCPGPNMSLKPVRVLVQWRDGTVRRLNEITGDDDLQTKRQVEVLESGYPRLWRLYLFVRPDLRLRGFEIQRQFIEALREEASLRVACEPALDFYLNEVPEFRLGRVIELELAAADRVRRLSEAQRKRLRQSVFKKAPALIGAKRVEEEGRVVAARTLKDDPFVGQVRQMISSAVDKAERKSGGADESQLKLDKDGPREDV